MIGVVAVAAAPWLRVAAPLAADPLPDGTSAPGLYQFAGAGQALLFAGKGWGHGVGLCQWGARGRALAGQTGEQIVAAYYQGTSIQKAILPDTTVRVLLDTGRQVNPGEAPRLTASGGKWQVETNGVPAVQASAGGYVEISADGGLHYTVRNADGARIGDGALRAPLVLRPQEEGTRFQIGYKPAGEVAGRPGAYYDTYRGDIVISPLADGLETVNRVRLDDYLKGVVPAEMPALWPAEAVKAQTLAARSYAVWQARGRAGERYDVDDTTQYQVYLGANAEWPSTNQTVDTTTGQVILYGGQVIKAYFFSTCAGWTENNEAVWPAEAPQPYLRGIHDVDAAGRPYDADAPRASWSTGALTTAQLEAILNGSPETAVGRLATLDLTQRTPSGRLLLIRASGNAGTKLLAPDRLMVRFNRNRPPGVAQLLSTNFDLQWSGAGAVAQTQGQAAAQATVQAAAPNRAPAPPAPTVVTAPGVPDVAVPPNSLKPATGTALTPAGALAPALAPAPAPPAAAQAAGPAPVYHLELTDAVAARPESSYQYMPGTGHNVGGSFLRFYLSRGGLDVFGLPRTEAFLEDGMTVQYFQRGRMELHLEKAGTPYEVQLTLLGDVLTADRRPFPPVAPFTSSAEHVYFPETGHGLHYGFLGYWRSRGGLDVFGYPISDEMTENGFTVQYFQRARFEYHPELPPAYRVSLGLLGDQLLVQRLWLK